MSQPPPWPPQPGGQGPQFPPYPFQRPLLRSVNGGLIMALGIMGLLICNVFGPFAAASSPTFRKGFVQGFDQSHHHRPPAGEPASS